MCPASTERADGDPGPVIEAVEFSAEGGADHEIVVTVPRRNRPAERGAGAVEDLVGGSPELAIVFVCDGIIAGRHKVGSPTRVIFAVFLEAAGVD